MSAEQPVLHRRGDTVQSQDGAYHTVRIECSCGKTARGISKDLDTARNQAQQARDEHLRRTELSPEKRRAENRIWAVLIAVPVIVVVGIVFLVVRAVSGPDEQPERYDAPGHPSSGDSGDDGIDCEKSVTYTMEQLYGSWGSGSWPDGEYKQRLAQCEGD